MHIAFFGSSLVSAYWNGAATYYRGMLRALYDHGHSITFYEPDAYERQRHRDIANPSWARVVVYGAEDTGPVCAALDEAQRYADLVVKASGVGVYDELLEEAVAGMRAPHRLTAFWDVDAPATLDRVQGDPDDPFRRLIPQYDLVFTYGGGDPVVNAYTALGARACHPIYNALDTSTHFPVAPDARFAADCGFLGNRLPDREARVEEFFLLPATQLAEKQFVLGGSGWGDKGLPPNVRYVGHVYTHDHNAFNCTAQTVLNINRSSMARYGFSPATRVFEAAGAGACILTDAFEGVELFFAPEEEILVAQDGAGVAAQLRELNPEAARRIGRAAYKRVLAEHTYEHRAAQVARILDAEGARTRARQAVGQAVGQQKVRAA
jgi:spore maturation protein CgeB